MMLGPGGAHEGSLGILSEKALSPKRSSSGGRHMVASSGGRYEFAISVYSLTEWPIQNLILFRNLILSVGVLNVRLVDLCA